MKYTRDVGTDVAMIGIWDPEHDRPELASSKLSEVDRALQQDALDGRLFYINTGADGGSSVDIYIYDDMPAERLRYYRSVGRRFCIVPQSGQLLAGGVEEYTQENKQITSPEDGFSVISGRYAIQVHELNDAELTDPKSLSEAVGKENYAYYALKTGGFPWGCLMLPGLLVGMAALYIIDRMAYTLILAMPVLLRYLFVWFNRRQDKRFQAVSKNINEFISSFPAFVFVLKPLPPDDDLKGGWYNLQ